MYNIAWRILRDQLQAEDVVQESFIEVFTGMHRFREDSSFGYWLKQIVINRSISALRKTKADPLKMTEDITDELSDQLSFTNRLNHEAGAPDDQQIALEVARIKAAIDRLPDGYRMVIILYLIEGYDHEEISEILAISAATSRSQYLRGKRKLLELLMAG